MTNTLTTTTQTPEALALLATAGQAANKAAAAAAFNDYKARKAGNTIKRQQNDLSAFEAFLSSVNLQPGDLANDPEAWRGVTWGLVAAFRGWQLQNGYAVTTVNFRLSTIKIYAGLACQAGSLGAAELGEIKRVAGYAHKEQKRIDTQRTEAELDTRKGTKKAEHVSITTTQATALKAQTNTPQGRRDNLLMALLLDHGLRCGEVAALKVTDFDLKAGELRFYRPKVDKVQTHRLTPSTRRAAAAYFELDAPALGSVWRASASKAAGKVAFAAGALGAAGMTERAITKRVATLGAAVGLAGLSAHDCRHYWATQAARNKTPFNNLKDAGGWNSYAMPLRYIGAAKVANEGVNLGDSGD